MRPTQWNEDTRGIAPQERMGAVEHLVVEDFKGKEPVARLRVAHLQIAEEIDDRLGHARHRRGGQLLDAVRMEVGVKKTVIGRAGTRIKNTVDKGKDVPVLLVKVNIAPTFRHAVPPCWPP